MKPLHIVDGRPLIAHSIDFAREFGVNHTVVVANQKNYLDGLDLIPGGTVVIQNEPKGVIDAIEWGIAAGIADDDILLLCSDNTFAPNGAWFRKNLEYASPRGSLLGVRVVTKNDATRFLYSAVRENAFLLKRTQESHLRWLGPVFFDRSIVAQTVKISHDYEKTVGVPMSVEDFLNIAGAPFGLVEMDCADHGIAK